MSEIKKVTEVEEVAIATEATALAEEAAAAEAAAPVEAVATDTSVSAYDPELLALIKKYGGDESVLDKLEAEYGVGNVSDLTMLKEDELAKAGLKLVKVRAMMKDLLQEAEAKEAAAEAVTKVPMAQMFTAGWDAILPAPSTEESFLRALRTGGILKVSDPTYECAIRVFLAEQCGLYNVPGELKAAIEKFADESEEPVPEYFWKLLKNITRREYGDLFSAIDGLDGSFVTPTRRKNFLSRVRNELFPAIREAYIALDSWYKNEQAVSSTPGVIAQTFKSVMTGSGFGLGVVHAPTDPVMDASNTLKDKINRVFRGTSAPVAAAMASDAMEITKFLDDPTLPAFIGVPNRDMMLKKLGINITANYARLEQNLVRFVLSYVKFEEAAAGNELYYLNSLWTLGNLINWEELGIVTGGSRVSAIGGNNML